MGGDLECEVLGGPLHLVTADPSKEEDGVPEQSTFLHRAPEPSWLSLGTLPGETDFTDETALKWSHCALGGTGKVEAAWGGGSVLSRREEGTSGLGTAGSCQQPWHGAFLLGTFHAGLWFSQTSCAGLSCPEPWGGQEEEGEPWGYCLVDKQDVYSVEEKEEAER